MKQTTHSSIKPKTHSIQPSISSNLKLKRSNACSCDLSMTYLIASQHLCIDACSYSNICSWHSTNKNPNQTSKQENKTEHVKTLNQNSKA